MEDKGTSVGLDLSEDLLKLRLPYLDNEMSNISISGLKRSNSMLPSTRRPNITPRRKPTDKTLASSKTIKDNTGQSSDEKSTSTDHLPVLPNSGTRMMYEDRNLFLDGTPYSSKSRSVAQTPREKTKPGDRVATMYCITNAGPDLYGKPDFSPQHRTRSQYEIVEQAKQMLTDSGFEDGKLLKNDIEKLGKGISSLYLSDYGLHQERISESSGMSLQKKLLPPGHVEEEVQNIALRHIYLSQIPSLIARNSPARRSVNSLRKTMRPHGLGRALHLLDRNEDSRRSRRSINSPRKNGDKSGLFEASLSKRTPFHSMENLHQIQTDRHFRAIDIQGEPITVHTTSKRIL